MTTPPKEFSPDWLLVPGESVFDLIREKRWDLEEFAARTGLSIQEVFALLKGRHRITSDLALSLSLVLGSTSDFWLAMEANYQKHLARKKASSIQADWQGWLKRMPVPELQIRGVLGKDPDNHIRELLSFFAMSSPGACELYYLNLLKTSCIEIPEPIDFGSVASWLRFGEIAFEKSSPTIYDRISLKASLSDIRRLTEKPHATAYRALKKILQDAGVLLSLVPALPGTEVSGAMRIMPGGHPMIQLAPFGKGVDQFWFMLFHEIGHLLSHESTDCGLYIDPLRSPGFSHNSVESERTANAFANDILIPNHFRDDLKKICTKEGVLAFAKHAELHPGIAACYLTPNSSINQSWINDLKEIFWFSYGE